VNAKALRAYPRGILDPVAYVSPRRPASPPTLPEQFVAAYPDPDPFVSLEQARRATHDDLVDMDVEDLDRERVLAMLRDAYAPNSITVWFRDRLLKLDAYAQRRR
jgi:hypothetical protein